MPDRLFVVDANLAVQKLVEYSLSKEGFEVTAFGDGLSALDTSDKIKPDIFIVEHNIAGIDLLKFCEKIKKVADLKDCPILLLVNPSDVYDEVILRSAGVVDFIKKPLESIDLITKAKRYLRPKSEDEEVEISEGEMVKIEELLGWSSPAATTSLFSELKDEKKSDLLDLNETTAEKEEPPKAADDLIFMGQMEETELKTELKDEKRPDFFDLTETTAEKEEPPKAADDLTETGEKVEREEASIKEKSLPKEEGIPSYIGQIPNDRLEMMIREAARELVEKIAWEVVPPLAEIAIKKELEKIKDEED